MPIDVVTADGRALTLTERVGVGAQGGVFRVAGSPLLAKLIIGADDASPTARKLDRMVRHSRAPRTVKLLGGGTGTGTGTATPPRAAWPLVRIATRNGRVVGFLMTDLTAWYHSFDVFFSPQSRHAAFPGITWALAVAAARDLSALVADLHAENYVIGDLKAGNLWLNTEGGVAISDADSFQFTDGEAFFACRVRSDGYIAPELTASPDRLPDEHTDTFALGVLVHQLLMCGAHPFAGVGPDGDYRGLDDNAARRRTRLLDPASVRVAPGTPPLSALPRPVRDLMKRCFDPGSGGPRSRPTAREWFDTLSDCAAPRALKQCSVIATHCYPSDIPWCPWCDVRAIGVDCFPQ
ncbi:DNA-binding helix-hairpin-helix protein with protein kinase domain [Catenulispora sp. EB89]|uniref:protein kinase domain-containing protein n=1 Tax=Catenulispora sp. EB89 TaxID=3156257 RepID=UPI003512F77D